MIPYKRSFPLSTLTANLKNKIFHLPENSTYAVQLLLSALDIYKIKIF